MKHEIWNIKHKGFTIIELIVAMGLFIILMGIAAGSFIKAMRTQRDIVALMAANDNASLALEQIAREIRTGYGFTTDLSVTELHFVNANNFPVVYRLVSGAIERDITINNITTYQKITADNVKVNNFKIQLFGQNAGDGYPPRITIAISVTGTDSSIEGVFTDIQTTISARNLDT